MAFPILSYQELFTLCTNGEIKINNFRTHLNPASINLPISDIVYELNSTFIPHGINPVEQYIYDSRIVVKKHVFTHGVFVLRRGHMYLLRIDIDIDFHDHHIGECQPRSTAGRSDIFVSVIQNDDPQGFNIVDGKTHALWVLVIPRSFNISIIPGDCFAQLRIMTTNAIAYEAYTRSISIDFTPDAHGVSLYRSRVTTDTPLLFSAISLYEARMFWDSEIVDVGDDPFFTFAPGYLYIARSSETISLLPYEAMDLIAYDASVGEFKNHFAGFFDPGFGMFSPTRAVFEIRVDFPMTVEHFQVIGQQKYLQLHAPTSAPYNGTYQGQSLRLGKQFSVRPQ